MSDEPRQGPITWQQWPCGPECCHAQPMPNTYGEWHWCNHPYAGGRIVRDGRDCIHFQAQSTLGNQSEASRWRG